MRVSVVFGTRANEMSIPHLERILTCLEQQTFQDFELIIVVDHQRAETLEHLRALTPPLQELFARSRIENLRLQGRFQLLLVGKHTGGASYVRNLGMQQAQGELIQLFDDDNAFEANYLELAVQHYDRLKQQLGGEVVICSTLLYRETGEVQNRGFAKWSFWQSRAQKAPYLDVQGRPFPQVALQLFSGNGLLFKAAWFPQVQYDEEIAWIAEDLDFTLSLYEQGAQLFSFVDLPLRHYEREKTFLELAWIGNKEQARQKARNWFLFLKKHGNFVNFLQFYLVGLPGCLLWLSAKALVYGGKQRRTIIAGLWKGVWEGQKTLIFSR